MKTTIEIADPLLEAARKLAEREKTTLRALVEDGLRRILEERKAARPYPWKDLTVGGQGLQPGIREGDWEQIRDIVYEGRGA